MSLVVRSPARRGAKEDVPLAVVRGGKRDGNLLYFTEDDGDALITLEEPEVFELIPETRPGMRSVYHIVGPSGAGKSTLAAGFSRNFQDVWPEGQIVVVSTVEDEDPAFAGVAHKRIGIDEDLNEIEMPELAELSGGSPTLLIFDDVEGLPKARKRALENFQQRALETGRKLNIHCLSLFHRAASGNATKSSLSEANGVCFFPKANTGNLAYALQKHFGVSPDIKRHLKEGWGRWILVRVDGYPSHILGERRAAVYDADEINAELKRDAIRQRAAASLEARQHPMD